MLELTWRLPTVVLLLSLPWATVATEGFPRTRERARAIREEIVHWRRQLHGRPELMYQEHLTSQFIQEVLTSLDIPFTAGWAKNIRQNASRPILGPGGTGVVAEIGKGEPIVALRADIDALPIVEETPVPYRSQHPGQMHACGHDGHTSMLLGAAKLLKETFSTSQPGTVRLIFQPAEEGGAGAKRMLEEGVLNGVSRIFGLHLFPSLPSGVIGGRSGITMAAADFFDFRIRGRGAHGAMPHMGVDPVTASAAVVQSLQSIVSRETDPLGAAVISVTKLACGDAYNVIPSSCTVGGTIRSLTSEGLDALRERVIEVSTQVASAHRCVLENATFMPDSFPPTENDPELWQWLHDSAGLQEGFPSSMLWDLPPTMGGEDFAFYTQKIPGAFIFLGQGSTLSALSFAETATSSTSSSSNVETAYRETVLVPTNTSLHSPWFHMDEDVLELGSALHAHMAMTSLHALSRPLRPPNSVDA